MGKRFEAQERFWRNEEMRAANSDYGELTFAAAYGITIRDDGKGVWMVHVEAWASDVAECSEWVKAVVVAHALALAWSNYRPGGRDGIH